MSVFILFYSYDLGSFDHFVGVCATEDLAKHKILELAESECDLIVSDFERVAWNQSVKSVLRLEASLSLFGNAISMFFFIVECDIIGG